MPRPMSSPTLISAALALAALASGMSQAGAADANQPSTQTPAPAATTPDGSTPKSSSGHTWELPALTVEGEPASPYKSDELVGEYAQPRWVTSRRFAEVRAYVLAAGEIDAEYWIFVDTPTRHDVDEARATGAPRPKTVITQQYEIEMGLGHHIQADVYQVYIKNGSNAAGDNAAGPEETKFEVRYALADWDKIWGNPTLYAEWIQEQHDADQAEFKLLLSKQIVPGWFAATNFVYQVKTGNDRETSHEWNTGVSYALVDNILDVGAEDHIGYVTARRADGSGGFTKDHDQWNEFLLGPSIRWHPVPNAHIDLTVFGGLTDHTSSSETVLITGWEF